MRPPYWQSGCGGNRRRRAGFERRGDHGWNGGDRLPHRRQRIELPCQPHEVAAACAREAEPLHGVLVDGGISEFEIKPALEDIAEPQHGVLLGLVHGLDGGQKGGMSGLGGPAGGEDLHGVFPDREEVSVVEPI